LLIFSLAVALVVFPITAIGKKMRAKTMGLPQTTGGITTKLAQNLSAVQEIRAFAMEASEVSFDRSMSDSVMHSVMKSLKYSILISPFIEAIASIGVGFAMFFSYKTQIQRAVFTALTGVLYLSYEPIKNCRIEQQVKGWVRSPVAHKKLLNVPENISDSVDLVQIERLIRNITFDNVSFFYAESKKR
jgi:ABC-type multidrug transport system fused ATPase/permease subunit